MSLTLTSTETSALVAAAGYSHGFILLPERMKPGSRERLLGRLAREGLAMEDGSEHRITAAGYRAVGLKPPRKAKAVVVAEASAPEAPAGRMGTKLELVRELLGRPDGATLDELIAATGWLPHTTRAVLSRLRSAGQALAKSPRPNGKAAYCIEPVSAKPEPTSARGGRRRTVEVAQAAA